MNWQVIKIRSLRWLRIIVVYGTLSVLSLLTAGFIILQVPQVQNSLLAKYITRFNEITGFNVVIGDARLTWYDNLELTDVTVYDPENNVMIRAKEISINFEVTNIWRNNDINIDGAALDSTEVNLITIQENDTTRNLNMNVFINRINSLGGGGAGGAPPKVNIGEIVLDRSHFTYNDTDSDSITNGFDYRHFGLQLTDGALSNFKVIGDTIQFRVNSLMAVDDKTQLDVKELRTFFRISQTSLEFLDLHCRAGRSRLADTVVFSYARQRDLSDFNRKVNIKAYLKDSYIHPEDLELFAPGAANIRQGIALSGRITGRVSRLNYRNMDLRIGNTALKGRIEMDGLPALNETFMTLSLNQSTVDINDLRFAFKDMVFDRLKPLGRFRLDGTFTGFINDFVADASIDGPLGMVKSNINLKINEANIDQTMYNGSLAIRDFNLGEYLQDTTTFQRVSMSGNVNGHGLTYATADFLLNGEVSSIGVLGYDYTNIRTNARFASQFFAGTFRIDDPNIRFNAQGSIDFRDNRDLVQIEANLDTAFLHRLGLSRKEFFITSYVDIKTTGLTLDSLVGDALFRHSLVRYNNQEIALDSVHLIAERDRNERHIELRSSLVNASLRGSYYYSTLFNDINKLYNELLLSIRNDKSAISEYYSTKRKSTQEYSASISLQIHDIQPLTKLAGLDLDISQGTKVEGRFANGLTSILQAYTVIDSIRYNDKLFIGNEIEFTGSKIRDSANVLAMMTMSSANQEITKALKTQNLLVEGIWNEDHIDLGIDVDQANAGNSLRLRSEVDFLRDSTRIKIMPSRIQALNKDWVVDQKNYTLFKGREFSINHLQIKHESETITLNGTVSRDPGKEITLTVNNLNLELLNTVSTEHFGGLVNGTVSGRNILDQPYIQNNIRISAFTINDFLIGDVTGINEWNPDRKRFDLNFTIDRLSERTMELTGWFDPAIKDEGLNIDASFNDASLKILEPVLRGIFSDMNGSLTGNYKITGSFSRPLISGTGNISDGSITVDYLKTTYTYTGEMQIKPQRFGFENFELKDHLGNTGTLEGFIAHRNFERFMFNLDGEFNNFQVLSTGPKDNSLFYGQAYATGKMNIFGPAANMKISATARTGNNTRIFIPIGGTTEVSTKDFISFAHFTDSATRAQLKPVAPSRELTGITLDLNLDITPAAYTEIIFDIKAGDIIRGRGRGDIRLQLDTKGEFNMFGGIQFTEGAYNFTLYDIINKEFTIKPGSRLTWYGDPYQGVLDITASYRQLASLATIFPDEEIASSPAIRRKYPLEVLLKLEGAMLSPNINFDLVANDLPNNVPVDNRPPVRLAFEFNAFKARLDEQELKRQVFSLIILRKLSPLDAFDTSGSIANSVSELLSNQLSYWLTQVDENLQIDLDLGALDTEAFNTFQLRLSYSFLNGRLRITRDGTFTSQQTQQSVASIAGDWTVDYLLTPDGKFRVKMYSRSNFNALTSSLGAQTAVTTGVSLMHTQNFNELKDLLTFARDKRRREMDAGEEPDNEEQDDDIEGDN